MQDKNTKNSQPPYRVLTIDGGGMRGLFSAEYLRGLDELIQKKGTSNALDFGSLFKLIVGTSTGAILACGLASNIPLKQLTSLYRHHGKEIFLAPLPKSKLKLFFHRRKKFNQAGEEALRNILTDILGSTTLGEIFHERKIALAIPAVDATTHQAWVFKTPHMRDTNHRDDGFSLADVCLASSAAPIYRSLAEISSRDNPKAKEMFVDGGLWANNPVLVGLTEALRCSEKDQPIHIYCLGTRPKVAGSVMNSKQRHWGLSEWEFGSKALILSMDAQSHVFDHMARILAKSVDRDISILRFPEAKISSEQSKYFEMDATNPTALDLFEKTARRAIDDTNIILGMDKNPDAELIKLLFKG